MSDNNCGCAPTESSTIFNPEFSNLKMKVVEYTAAAGDTCFDSSSVVTLAAGTCINADDVQLTKAKLSEVVSPEYLDVVNALLAGVDFATTLNTYTVDIAGAMSQADLKLLIKVNALTNLQVVTP